ncbi:MAG: hypothetical protein K2Q10_08260, partial [Rhodospirillales bacterium]|nr:hypothetical protein [Rhodospirillales bacterium]
AKNEVIGPAGIPVAAGRPVSNCPPSTMPCRPLVNVFGKTRPNRDKKVEDLKESVPWWPAEL